MLFRTESAAASQVSKKKVKKRNGVQEINNKQQQPPPAAAEKESKPAAEMEVVSCSVQQSSTCDESAPVNPAQTKTNRKRKRKSSTSKVGEISSCCCPCNKIQVYNYFKDKSYACMPLDRI